MQLEVLGGIIHGTHDILLHEIVFDEIGEPDAFAQDTLDFHQSLAMCQQIGVQIFVEENIRSHIAGTGIPRIREEIRIRFLRDIIHWFHHLGISIRIGSDVVDKLLGSSCHFLLVFGRICKITWANILANIFLFIIFLYNIYIIINIAQVILQIFVGILLVNHIFFIANMPDGSVEGKKIFASVRLLFVLPDESESCTSEQEFNEFLSAAES